MAKRELRSGGTTSTQSLDTTKVYKLNSAGAVVESTGTPAGTDILFSGSRSSLRRLTDLERNVSILAARTQTEDGSGDGSGSGVVEKANRWNSSRTITLAGDLTGNVSIRGDADVTLTATVAANSVALGTDTTGNYMSGVTAGTGISVSHTAGEGSTATISVSNGVYTTDTGTVTNTMLAGSIADTKLSTISTAGKVSNSATTAASANTASAIVARDASGNFTAGTITAALTGNSSGTHTGAVVGNASTATTLATARAIQGVSFDGSAAITVVTAGTGVSVSGTAVSIGQAVGTGSNVTFNDLTVSGNLTVSGTTTSINTATLDVADLNITVAKNASTAAAANGAGLTVAGPAVAATLTYSSADDRWNMNKTLNATLVGNVTGNVTGSAGTVTSISGNTLSSGQVTTALGFTPYNATNPSGYTTNVGTVTGVTATGPVVSSGGTAPVISMAAATTSVSGYLTSTDWNTFNGKQAALGFTPYNSTNPSGYVTSTILASTHTGALTTSSACSTGALTVTGGITATGEITAYYSDDRLKKDVVAITDPIQKLMQIRGVTFRPNQTALDLGIVDKDEVGVIAQEVQAVLPQLVTGSAFDGYITVKYDKLTALLIEAVKAQQQQIDELKFAVAQLRGL